MDLVKAALGPHLDALGRGRDVFLYDLESAARTGTAGPARTQQLDEIQPKRSVSPLGDALRGALAAHRGRPVAGIVLVTDGRSNAGEDPIRVAEAAVRLGIPIYPIAAGAEEGPRNVRLAEIEASPVVFARDPMTLGVVVEARGLKRRRGRPHPRSSGSTAATGSRSPTSGSRSARTASSSGRRSGSSPRSSASTNIRARVEDAGPELTQDDNTATAAVRVVRQQIRVLMIAGAPSPEVQFLRNALQRDQHVEFAAWLQHADPGYRQAGDRPITRLPNDAEELGRYDALVLIDPDMQALGPQWPDLIANFVGKDGGGLIFIPGELYSQQLFEADDAESDSGGKWTRILPVVREPGPVPDRGRGPPEHADDLRPGPDPRGARRPDLRVPPRPDPQPDDPGEPARDVLELPRHPRPARARPSSPATATPGCRTSTAATSCSPRSSTGRAGPSSSGSTARIAGDTCPRTISTASGPG